MAKGQYKIRSHKPVSSGYYMPESMPLVLCGACLIIALEYSKKAKDIYNQIVESYRLPDIKEMFNELDSQLTKPGSNLINCMKNEEYGQIVGKWFDLERDKIKSVDFKYWHGLINELIRVGFNQESEQDKGIYKIKGESSPTMVNTIMIRSLAQYNHVELVNDKAKKAIKIAGRTYDFTKLIELSSTTRRYRDHTKAYKKAGYKRHQDEKIAQIAAYWYLSRVKYSGPTEFCNEASRNGIILDESNVSNEIRQCDYAMGYPRGDKQALL